MELKTQDSRNGIYSENPIPYFHGILSREKESGLEGKTGGGIFEILHSSNGFIPHFYFDPCVQRHTYHFRKWNIILGNGVRRFQDTQIFLYQHLNPMNPIVIFSFFVLFSPP